MINNKYLMSALSVAAVSLSVGTAQSARMPGSSGHQWPNPMCAPGMCGVATSGTACFDHSNGLMENRCNQTTGFLRRLLVIPVPISSTAAQNHTFSARIKGNGDGTGPALTTCQALVINNNNAATGSSLGETGSDALLTKGMGAISVPADGVVQVECQVAGNSTTSSNRGGVLRVNADPS